jgi:tagaturonate reductase
MNLSAQILEHIEAKDNVLLPKNSNFDLPEKVLQFGTGVLLRGLPDYYIDKANKQGIFNGRIVMVKSTTGKNPEQYAKQDNIFTHCVRGYENGKDVNEYIVNASISRLLNANDQWIETLKYATSKDMQIIISNTTEVGIVLNHSEDLNNGEVPKSFPGKITAFLYKRYLHFNSNANAGMVILPTELIVNNGGLLKSICQKLARKNYNDTGFDQWLIEANDFCDTLVDRIVPGALPPHECENAEDLLGYKDELMIMSEPYSLWAIQSDRARTKEILSFATIDKGIVISENIEKFRNLKLRLLNGAHTFSCGLALISGFETVKEAMGNLSFENFIQDLMLNEIAQTLISNDITEKEAINFSQSVMDRFRNPFIEHKWEAISTNYSAKMAMRNVPTILEWYEKKQTVPKQMAMGFAAYLYFLKADVNQGGTLFRTSDNKQIKIDDALAPNINGHFNEANLELGIHNILSDKNLWNTDLSILQGFEEAIINNIKELEIQTKRSTNLV